LIYLYRFFTILRLGGCRTEPDRRDGRMTKDNGGDQMGVETALCLGIEEAVGETAPGGDGYGRECRAAGHIANRVDTRCFSILERIYGDESQGVGGNICLLQAEIGAVGTTTDGPDDGL
jgi:hypothetical protein